MSTASHAPADHGADSHDHAHAFDGEPVAVLADDEPKTPGWVPVLGLSLFALAAVAFFATRDPAPPGEGAPAKPAQAAVDAPAPPPPAPAPPPPAGARGAPPAGSGSPLTNMSPEQLAALKKRIEEMRTKHGALPIMTAAPQPAPAPH